MIKYRPRFRRGRAQPKRPLLHRGRQEQEVKRLLRDREVEELQRHRWRRQVEKLQRQLDITGKQLPKPADWVYNSVLLKTNKKLDEGKDFYCTEKFSFYF